MSDIAKGMLIAVCCAIIFGLYPAAVQGVYRAGGNPAFIMITTTWARAATLLFYCLARRLPVFRAPQSWGIVFFGGALSATSLFGVLSGLEYLPGALVLMILYTHTLMLLLFMAWRGEHKLTAATLLSTISALFGLALVLDVWHTQSKSNLIGIAFVFMAAVATMSRLYAYGKQTQLRNPAIVGAETFCGSAYYVACIVMVKTPHAPTGGEAYIYLAFACASLSAGTFGMFYGISLLGAFRWSLFLKMEPVFVALFSFLLLGEVLKPLQYLGMGIVLGSLAAYQIVTHRVAAHRRSRRLDLAPEVE